MKVCLKNLSLLLIHFGSIYEMCCHHIILLLVLFFSFQELYGDCDKLRGTVFKLTTENEDNDGSLGTQNPMRPAILLAK